ncbi:MAG: cyclase family protein [Clostridiales bacterium]|nr:cyclase family protein [Clostridiales bacterium]
MIKYIDLSHEITNDTPVYPGDAPARLSQYRYLDTDGYNCFKLETGMHAGTHIDIPMHLIESTVTIDKMPLDTFAGDGCLLDVRGKSMIGYEDKYLSYVSKDDVVLLYTGYDNKYGTEEYYSEHPVIEKELADFFISRQIKMLGFDMPSPDRYPYEIHKILLTNGISIIENMANLSKLLNVGAFEIVAFPLKIRAEASMVRAVARI